MAPRSVARELTMGGAIEAMESNNRSNGASGVDDVIQIFGHRGTASDLLQLDDKSYHRLFEALFQYTLSEKEAYYHGKGSKAIATGRLFKCAEALRWSLEHAASKLKRKTLLAIIDHITDILPHSDGGLVPPLVSDYIKALAALLGHRVNVETLATYNSGGWFTCVDFVVDVISQLADDADRDMSVSRASPAPSASGSMTHTSLTTRSRGMPKRGNSNDRSRLGHLPDLMECLVFLVAAPNAPLLQRTKDISSVALHVLQLRSLSLAQIHQFAFALINAVLVVTQTDDSTQAGSLAVECLPLVAYWWRAGTASDRDALLNVCQTEMLKVLYNIYLQLEFLTQQDSETPLFEDIEHLSEVLWNEYSKRDDRAQLQQDDLTYMADYESISPFCIQSFTLRYYNVEGEKRWAVVQVLAMLEAVLWKRSKTLHLNLASDENDEHPRKKQRKDIGSSRLRYKLRSIDRSTQFTALQMIPFFVSEVNITAEETSDILCTLISLVTNKNSRLSTWAMIACASLAAKAVPPHDSFNHLWKQAWQVAVRSVSMAATCRAASFLLHSILEHKLLAYSEIMSDTSDIVTTADVNGPAVLVDSSLVLMTALLQLRNHHLPSASHASNNHVIRWMMSRWFPADTNFISFYSMHVSPLRMANIIRTACGNTELTFRKISQTIGGPIAETLILLRERESLVKYLLLLNDGTSSLELEDSQKVTQPTPNAILRDSTSTMTTTKLVAELFYSKLEEIGGLCSAWAKKTEGSGHITPEKLQSVVSCLLLGALLLPQLKEVNTRQSQETEDVIFRILTDMTDALRSSPESQSLYDCLLRSMRGYLPEFTSSSLGQFSTKFPYLHRLVAEIFASLYRQQLDLRSPGQEYDPMDIDDEFGSQGGRPITNTNLTEVSRRESHIVLQASSFYSDTIQRLHLLQQLHEDETQIGLVPTSFLDSFLLLSSKEIISCRCFIKEVFSSDLIISPDDAISVVVRIGGLIGKSIFLSCEVALNICLDLMEGFIEMWSSGAEELSDPAKDLYKHYLKKGLSNNLLSPSVQISLSRLLFRLAQVGETFPKTVDMGPPNTSLLSILESSPLPVKFFIGARLPVMFGRYVLKTHEDMFINILENLPSSNTFLEGIALRLFVLGEVAREWPTLLRRGIYHIFETPGKVPDSKKHAIYCLKRVAATLKLDDSMQLFDLFASQLLYTWLHEGVVEEIPFEVFGFPSLEALLHRSQADVVALMVMRAQDEALLRLATALGTTPAQLVEHNFSKTLAYSMAHDISMPKGEQSQSGESRLRRLLGREPFLENVYLNFADIIGTFVSLIDQEDVIEKWWAKK